MHVEEIQKQPLGTAGIPSLVGSASAHRPRPPRLAAPVGQFPKFKARTVTCSRFPELLQENIRSTTEQKARMRGRKK